MGWRKDLTKAATKVATKVAWLGAKEAKTVAGAVEAKSAATGEVGKHVNEDILANGMTEFVGHQPLLCLFNASMYFLVVKRREILARNKLLLRLLVCDKQSRTTVQRHGSRRAAAATDRIGRRNIKK